MIWARRLKLLTKFGVAALALGALAACGNAQTVYKGQFTLPFETHWEAQHCPLAITLLLCPPRLSIHSLHPWREIQRHRHGFCS